MFEDLDGSEIAIIGIAGRFPGSRNKDEFWRNIRDGVESIRFLTDQQLESSGVEPALLRDPNYVRAAAPLDDIELFDASFFGINPREAELMDPQHRVILECSWEAMENAGYDPDNFEGAIGVYAGATINTYLLVNICSNPDLVRSLDDLQINIGNGGDFLTTRVSYKLNLKGPSHLVQSACSTSLVAVHSACQSLLNEECDMALAGGVSINLKFRNGYRYIPGGMMSPDGRCRAFDAKAQGTVFGSGAGIVVLRRLKDALADRDNIQAIIKGSAINNDGSLKVGYTAPSVDGQAGVITEALANAGVGADTITYVETHGTGTPLGDPIEIQALTKAFTATTKRKGFCAIGSVKTNIGHLDAAAGVAGLIKTVQALKEKLIPPSLHYEHPNPDIDFENSPFFVNSKPSAWRVSDHPRRAGVSAFGVGGTNAHLILQEAPDAQRSCNSRPWQLLVMSANTASALETATINLKQFLQRERSVCLPDVAYTLKVGRKRLDYRRVAVCTGRDDAIGVLDSLDFNRAYTCHQMACERPVVFMFSGQGTQYVNMGSGLYRREAEFRKQIDRCSDSLRRHLGIDLRSILYPRDTELETAAHQLNQTWITQPALFVIEYALAKMWMSWGIYPQAMIGHSIGEYVAACLADVFSLEDALSLVSIRGRLIQDLPGGAMLAIPLAAEEVQPLLGDNLEFGAINAPTQCVVSGPADDILELETRLTATNVACRRLQSSHAFHSRMMEPITESFLDRLKQIEMKSPSIPFVSNVTGTWMTREDAGDANYWVRHLRRTVRFTDGLQELMKQRERVLLETGPGESLCRLVKRHQPHTPEALAIPSIKHPSGEDKDGSSVMMAAGKLWAAGVVIDWTKMYQDEQRWRIEIPTYPFERQRYWIEKQEGGSTSRFDKQTDIGDWFYVPTWKQSPGERRKERNGEEATWVVLEDEIGIGEELVRRLKNRREEVVTVKWGEVMREKGDKEYEINGRRKEDYKQLVREIEKKAKGKTKLVHLWSLSNNKNGDSGIRRFEDAQETGFNSLLLLVQALGSESTRTHEIIAVSNNVIGVTGAERCCPEKTTMLGLCKVIPQEYRNVDCRFIDIAVDPQEDSYDGFDREGARSRKANAREAARRKLVESLLAEAAGGSTEPVVACRGNQRWVQTIEPVQLAGGDRESATFRRGGVYVVTGGLTGIGFALSKYLAKSEQATLIVVDNFWLQQGGDPGSQDNKTERVRALRDLGATVSVFGAEVGNTQQMREIIETTVREHGKIHGVIHAANIEGKMSFRAIQEIDPVECRWQFAPKIDGLYVLDELLGGMELDFCVLVSSLSSLLGGVGSVANSSANAFVDAFARNHRPDSPVNWMSINWDAWNLDDGEQLTALSEELARLAMTQQEGGDAFRRIVSACAADQIIVSTADLRARILGLKTASLRHTVEPPSTHAVTSLYPRPHLDTPFVSPRTQLEKNIAEAWQATLGIEQVGIDDKFFDLGGDSLLALQVVSTLKSRFDIEVPVVSLYEMLTIRAVAASQELAGQSSPSVRVDAARETRVFRRKDYQQQRRSKKAGTRIEG